MDILIQASPVDTASARISQSAGEAVSPCAAHATQLAAGSARAEIVTGRDLVRGFTGRMGFTRRMMLDAGPALPVPTAD